MDWESLREDIKQFGMRNSTLMAQMPVESSSLITNSTNGGEPPRAYITDKGSKSGTVRFVVPNLEKHKEYYTLAYDVPNNEGYLKVAAAMQKFIDMAMSTNTYYSPSKYADKKVPTQEVIKDILTSYKYGLKALYYANTDDGDNQFSKEEKSTKITEEKESEDCIGGACRI